MAWEKEAMALVVEAVAVEPVDLEVVELEEVVAAVEPVAAAVVPVEVVAVPDHSLEGRWRCFAVFRPSLISNRPEKLISHTAE